MRQTGKAPRRTWFLLLVIVLALSFSGCPCTGTAINAIPASLQWWLFSNYGASRVCPEMLKKGVSLRLSDRSPAIGRFFPTQCSHSVDDSRRTIVVNVAGTGYGYMQPARRVGFSLTTSVEYRPELQGAGSDVYVWGKLNRIVSGPTFQLGSIENSVVDVAANVPPFGSIANFLGTQVVASEMTRGFTVIHNEDSGDDFSLGILMPPQRPHHPFDVTDSDRFTFANETVEVNSNQRDYLGPFEVPDADTALYVRMAVQGPSVDVMVVDRRVGDAWREAYQTGRPMGPPPGPVLAGAPLSQGVNSEKLYRLPPGQYYVVVDNTTAAGLVNPPMSFLPFGDTPALVSYIAQLTEAD